MCLPMLVWMMLQQGARVGAVVGMGVGIHQPLGLQDLVKALHLLGGQTQDVPSFDALASSCMPLPAPQRSPGVQAEGLKCAALFTQALRQLPREQHVGQLALGIAAPSKAGCLAQ